MMLHNTEEDIVSYSELKEATFDGTFVYSVSDDALPSQYRSLKLFPHSDVEDLPELEVNMRKSRPSTRMVYVVLVLLFLMSLMLVSIFTFVEVRRVFKSSGNSRDFVVSNSSGQPATEDTYRFLALPLESKHGGIQPVSDERTPCLNTCRTYSQPRFLARCVDWFCVCDGEGYRRLSCLPEVGQCVMRKLPAEDSNAFIGSSLEPVFQCRTKTVGVTEVHIISIHGNHFAKQTVVNISGQRKSPCVIILASHFPVNWKLKYSDLNIRNIYLVSHRNSFDSFVDFTATFPNNNRLPPDVTQLNIPVGYGDDRHSGNTTEMLQILIEKFGHINSFTGAAFSDYFNIKI